MKKIISTILLSSLSAFVFGQSITLDPKTTAPASFLLKGDFGLSKKVLITTVGTVNALDRQNSSRVFIDVSGSVILNGIADGTDGTIVFIYTGVGTTLTINNANTGALSNNQILTHTGGTVTITSRGGATLIYENSSSKWRIISFADEVSSSAWNLTGNAGTTSANFIGTTDAQPITFRTNNTAKATLTSTGRLGIGITLPLSLLHVFGATSGATPANSQGLTIEGSSQTYINVLSSASGFGTMVFGRPSVNQAGWISYDHVQERMRLGVDGTDKVIILGNGNMGIGSTSPTAKLHVDGDFALKKKVLLTGNGGHSDYDRAGASVISIATPGNGGGGETLGGIADGVDGLIIHIYPVQGTSFTLVHESTSSLAANRIILHTGSTVTFTNNGGATLMYDSTVSRWRVIGIAN